MWNKIKSIFMSEKENVDIKIHTCASDLDIPKVKRALSAIVLTKFDSSLIWSSKLFKYFILVYI